MKENQKTNLKLILETISFLILFSLVILTSRNIIKGLQIGNTFLPADSFLGIISVFEISVAIAMTLSDFKRGSIIAISLLTINSSNTIISIIIRKNIRALPGLFMIIAGLCFVIILRTRLKIIDANNKTYEKMSITDSLTSLTNRRGMREIMKRLISENRPFYFLFIDLDNFKYINDTIGHYAGDIILKTVANRCSAVKNPEAVVSRNGGDEFTIIIPDRKGLSIDDYVDKYMDEISRDIYLADANIHYSISACIGVSHFPQQATELDDIINYADTAMYEAKRAGKKRVMLFNKSMADQSIHDKSIEEIIKKGLADNRFYMVYQPQYETSSHKLRGFESLIRLKNEDGNIISPGEFIPVAEQSDLILDIDHFVMRSVMNQFVDVAKKALNNKEPFSVSINISAKHISDPTFIDDMKAILNETGYPPQCLEVEITEYCMIRNLENATFTLNELSKLGIAIALDDFGTGYASLSNLSKLPIDLLKIDKSFIDTIASNASGNDFIEAIITMGHSMHCDIISEGVETEGQLEFLKNNKCDYIQGYIWGRPLDKDQAMSLC